jgi:hypothetical protein
MATVDRPKKRKPGPGRPRNHERDARIVQLAKQGALRKLIAVELGINPRTVRKVLAREGVPPPARANSKSQAKPVLARVPNDRLCEAIRQSAVSLNEICHEIGYSQLRYGNSMHADTSKLKRALGMNLSYNRKRLDGVRSTHYQTTIPIALAERICVVIGVDFDELYPEIAEQEPEMICKGCGAEMRKRVRGGLCGLCEEERNPVPSALALELEAAKEYVA